MPATYGDIELTYGGNRVPIHDAQISYSRQRLTGIDLLRGSALDDLAQVYDLQRYGSDGRLLATDDEFREQLREIILRDGERSLQLRMSDPDLGVPWVAMGRPRFAMLDDMEDLDA